MRHELWLINVLTTLLFLGAAPMPATSKHAYGTIRRSCAPWDGASIALTITPEPSSCDVKRPFLTISVYDLPIQTGKAYKIGVQGSQQIGQAMRCPKDNCESADSGEVVFDKFDDNKTAAGHYTLHFRDGEISGSFELKWCPGEKFCG